jgi:CRP-like cAMP-binding protein
VEESSETSRAVSAQARLVASMYGRTPEIWQAERPASRGPLPEGALSLLERLFVLFEMPILRRAGVQTLALIAGRAEEIRLGPSDQLFSSGTRRDRLFVVVHGEVQCGDAGHGPGTIVEGAGALGGGLTTTEARARQEAIVLAVSVEEWFDAMEEHADLLRCTLRWFSLERERVLDALAARQGELVLE